MPWQDNHSIDQHSLPRSVFLHLFPGALILAFFVITAPIFERCGAPSLLALLLGMAFVLIPLQLGTLLYQGKKVNGTFSLMGVLRYREPLPGWQYAALAIPLLLWSGLMMTFVSPPIDHFLIETLFSWLPDWFFFFNFTENLGAYTRPALLLTAVLNLLLNGLLGPIVEELYFRGYLLPRIAYLGRWAPLVDILLFSLYHFFSPWQNPGRILAITPLYYSVWWKENITLGILVHCAANLAGGVIMLPVIRSAV